jgi:hypothetical protein
MRRSSANAGRLLCAVMVLTAAIPLQARTQKAPPDIVVTDQDDGKEITLHGDQRLIVRLPSPGGTAYIWSALMRPDSVVAFAKNPAPKDQKRQDRREVPIPGAPQNEEFAFHAAWFTETRAEPLTLILCPAQCDVKDPSTKLFKVSVTTRKN